MRERVDPSLGFFIATDLLLKCLLPCGPSDTKDHGNRGVGVCKFDGGDSRHDLRDCPKEKGYESTNTIQNLRQIDS